MALIWSPGVQMITDDVLIARMAAMTYAGRTPQHASLVAMLEGLSRYILNDPAARQVPQYVALAYWLRPAALRRLCADLGREDVPGVLRVPRGIALHLPPSNVDTIFAYSWAMSVLAGNANIVRLPETLTMQTQWLVGAVSHVVAQHNQEDRNLFCYYAYGGKTEHALARLADLRMIWGGDAKVEAVSRVPIRPDGLSIGFPDRQSLAIVAADAYGRSNAAVRDTLATNFFNDVFWFDQMGCGSPRMLVWLGEPHNLAEDFYNRVKSVIQQKGYSVDAGVAISKFVLANELLSEGITRSYRRYANTLDVSNTGDPFTAIARGHGGGFLCDWVAGSLDHVARLVTRKVQTLTHFGLSADELLNLAKGVSGRGCYRMVPIGQALQFDATWDGVNLFQHMTRCILLRTEH